MLAGLGTAGSSDPATALYSSPSSSLLQEPPCSSSSLPLLLLLAPLLMSLPSLSVSPQVQHKCSSGRPCTRETGGHNLEAC